MASRIHGDVYVRFRGRYAEGGKALHTEPTN